MSSYISLIFKTVLVLFLLSLNPAYSQTVDSNVYYKINSIKISGNKKTKDRIILRELIKKEKDTFLLRNIKRFHTREEYNIFNTQLFIYDSIKCVINDSSRLIDYTIKVKERWYIWPIPFVDYLDRNINSWWQTKDIQRLSYGIELGIENFSGVNDRLILICKTGYANQFGFNYRLPYLNSKQTFGAYAQFVFSEHNKLQYVTLNNKQQFVTDEKNHLLYGQNSRIGIFFRPHLFLFHTVDLSYSHLRISQAVSDLNPNYFFKGSNTTAYVSLLYKLTFDDRDNKIYPLKGTMFEMTLVKDGFDLGNRSSLDRAQSFFSIKKYFPIHRKLNFATQLKTRYLNTDQKLPFVFNQALGYSNYVRGYEYYVIDGQNYFLTKNSLRFQLIKPKFHEVGMLNKLKPFSTIPFYAYLNVFYDGAYVKESIYIASNSLANSWQHGYGIGLDIITYYDFVMRMEYSFNKQKQSGFFIHLTSGF